MENTILLLIIRHLCPKADAVTSNYYDCVGVTPYVRIGAVSRDGYILKGWEVSGRQRMAY